METNKSNEAGAGDRPRKTMTYLDFTTLEGMTGEITALDIGNGQQGICELCPVALALARMFEGCETDVNMNDATIDTNGETLTVLRISEALADWIEAYDFENKVSPVKLRISTWNRKGYEYMLDIAA